MVWFYCLLLYLKKERNVYLILAGMFFSLSILMRFTSLILGFVVLSYFFIKKIKCVKFLWFFASSFFSLLPYIFYAQIKYGNFLLPFIRAQTAVSDLVGNKFFYFIHFNEIFCWIVSIGILIFALSKIFSNRLCQVENSSGNLAGVGLFCLLLYF